MVSKRKVKDMDYRWKWRRLGAVGGRLEKATNGGGNWAPFGEAWSHLGTRTMLKGLAAVTRPTSPLAIRLLHPPLPISPVHPFPDSTPLVTSLLYDVPAFSLQAAQSFSSVPYLLTTIFLD